MVLPTSANVARVDQVLAPPESICLGIEGGGLVGLEHAATIKKPISS